MIPRILEAEVMDSAIEAADYDAMDHREVNARFASDFLQALSAEEAVPHLRVLDVGAGTALIPIEIVTRSPRLRITAIDLAEEMLKLGRRNVQQAGLSDRITLLRADAKEVFESTGPFDAVISNTVVHHIPDPLTIFRAMQQACRPGGLMFVRDLLRPESTEELERLVEQHAGAAEQRPKKLFADSLHAALTLDEVRKLLAGIRIPREAVNQTSDRHWTLCWRTPG